VEKIACFMGHITFLIGHTHTPFLVGHYFFIRQLAFSIGHNMINHGMDGNGSTIPILRQFQMVGEASIQVGLDTPLLASGPVQAAFCFFKSWTTWAANIIINHTH
jgi:hypothetical protein